jgi:histidinol-phosphate phosphatase family protein
LPRVKDVVDALFHPEARAASPGFRGVAERLAPGRCAVFIDQDDTLTVAAAPGLDPSALRFTSHAMAALRCLDRAGYALVVVTQEPGLAAGRFTRSELARVQRALVTRVWEDAGVELAGFYTCPHAAAARPASACLCRKPAPGMLRQAALSHHLDLKRSWMVGDTLDDVEAGRRAGCRTVLIEAGTETQWRRSPLREPDLRALDLLEAARLILRSDAALAAGAAAQSTALASAELQ